MWLPLILPNGTRSVDTQLRGVRSTNLSITCICVLVGVIRLSYSTKTSNLFFPKRLHFEQKFSKSDSSFSTIGLFIGDREVKMVYNVVQF